MTVWFYHSPSLLASKEKPMQHPCFQSFPSHPCQLLPAFGSTTSISAQCHGRQQCHQSHQNTQPAKKAKHVGLPDAAANLTAGHQSAALVQATVWGVWGGNSGVVFELCLYSLKLQCFLHSKDWKKQPKPGQYAP